MRRLISVAALVLVIEGGGCGNRGSVTFTVQFATVPSFRPASDQITEYLLRTSDGNIVGVASESVKSPQQLALGPLVTTTAPEDVNLSVLSGAQLVGMARIRNVTIKNGVQLDYEADVRKPLIFVGSTVADENPTGVLNDGLILDPTTSTDLAHPPSGLANPPSLPKGDGANGVTSDGRFLLQAMGPTLRVVSTDTFNKVGELTMRFTPTRIVVAPRDRAAVVLGSNQADGAGLLFTDVLALETNPTGATPISMALAGDVPRNAAFSPDGARLYVLGGGAAGLDACGGGTMATANTISVFGLDGKTQATWTLSTFAADLAVDPDSGQIVLSLANANQVAAIDPTTPSGSVTPKMLFPATCPSALRVTTGQIFVITAGRPNGDLNNDYTLEVRGLGAAATVAPTVLPFQGPFYEAAFGFTPDGNTAGEIKIQPTSIVAYELAVTPDGSRAVFATRAHYVENNQMLDLKLAQCTLSTNIVEYGLYNLDTRTGAARYEARSQNVVAGNCKLDCPGLFGTGQSFMCTSAPMAPMGAPDVPRDRPAGIAAVFGGL